MTGTGNRISIMGKLKNLRAAVLLVICLYNNTVISHAADIKYDEFGISLTYDENRFREVEDYYPSGQGENEYRERLAKNEKVGRQSKMLLLYDDKSFLFLRAIANLSKEEAVPEKLARRYMEELEKKFEGRADFTAVSAVPTSFKGLPAFLCIYQAGDVSGQFYAVVKNSVAFLTGFEAIQETLLYTENEFKKMIASFSFREKTAQTPEAGGAFRIMKFPEYVTGVRFKDREYIPFVIAISPSSQEITINKLEIGYFFKGSGDLHSRVFSELSEFLYRTDGSGQILGKTVIPAGQIIAVMNPYSEVSSQAGAVRVRLKLDASAGENNFTKEIEFPVENRLPPVRVHSPVKGRWRIVESPDFPGIWQKKIYNDRGRLFLPGLFAFEMVGLGEDGREFRGDGSRLQDYHAFGRKIHSPLDGVVEYVKCDVTDSLENRCENIYSSPGNYIVIRHSSSLYSVTGGFQKDSIKLIAGDRVKKGQAIGIVGARDGKPPRVHFRLQNSKDMEKADGVPVSFENAEFFRGSSTVKVEDGLAGKEDILFR